MPQILHHRDPIYKLAISTPKWRQLRVPIDAVVSFREDDVLCVPQIKEHCLDKKGGLRSCTLLVTDKNVAAPPFPDACGGDIIEAERELCGIENVRILRSRLNESIISDAVARMPSPCRVVVSGPDGFNSAAQTLLYRFLDKNNITILSA